MAVLSQFCCGTSTSTSNLIDGVFVPDYPSATLTGITAGSRYDNSGNESTSGVNNTSFARNSTEYWIPFFNASGKDSDLGYIGGNGLAVPLVCDKIIVSNAVLALSRYTTVQQEVVLRNAQLSVGSAANLPDSIGNISGTGVVIRLSTVGPNTNATTVSTNVAFALNGANSNSFTGSALDAASVNHILESMVANSSANFPGTLDLSGGTAAGTSALTAAGAAALATLTGAGWTITLNP